MDMIFVIYAMLVLACILVVVGKLVLKFYQHENFKIALVAIAGFALLVEASGILH